MGYPGKHKKLYDTPNHPWQKARIDEETGIVKKYGLRNKKGVWKFASELRKYRGNARTLLGVMAAGNLPEDSHYIRDADAIVRKLQNLGVLKEDSKLEDILALKIDDLLERRLQTMVFRKGYANSMKQARQFIVHGHISLNGRKITVPSYMVLKSEEDAIGYYVGSPITKEKLASKPVPVAAPAKPAAKAPAPAAAAAPAETAAAPAAAPKEE
ncbi:MAG: 30S ribosomal protein S4 [Methanocella sp. PtaU1.Bin125]|nr:MAG: 30S ribosomal protein S4 [Methanocella sp. PtaU1.Bin125]